MNSNEAAPKGGPDSQPDPTPSVAEHVLDAVLAAAAELDAGNLDQARKELESVLALLEREGEA